MDKSKKKVFETELTDDELLEMTGGATYLPTDGSICGSQPISMKYGIKLKLTPQPVYGVKYGVAPAYGVRVYYGIQPAYGITPTGN